MYHSTNQEIKSISKDGLFGSFLFFSGEDAGHGELLYEIDTEKLNTISAKHFYYDYLYDSYDEEILKKFEDEIIDICNCSREEAQDYLSESSFYNDDYEISFDIQHIQAKCSIALGFDGVDVEDEHGISTMFDMFGNESKLRKVH